MIEITYKCDSCDYKFVENTSEMFIKSTLPTCPSCKSIGKIKTVMVKKIVDKIDNR